MSSPLLECRGLHKHYRLGGQDLHILRGVDLAVRPGEWLAILGASGSGKSTLLHLLGGLDRPSAGSIVVRGKVLVHVEPPVSPGPTFLQLVVFGPILGWLRAAVEFLWELTRHDPCDDYRANEVGFVFQFYHLLPEFSALENVVVAAMIRRSALSWMAARGPVRGRAKELLEHFGLGSRLRHKPAKLSGGERQRVAIARALINKPAVLLADEPTGNLDADTGRQIIDMLRRLHKAGQTIVMVTHDERLAAAADRVLKLEQGQLK